MAAAEYHTRLLAVDDSSNDHQPVIDCYLREVEKLLNGVTFVV